MGKLKALDQNLNLTDKRIILRIDLNVPMQEGKVTDKSRIKKITPIIKEFINKKAKVILISHLGRPKGKIDKKLSLKVLSALLSMISAFNIQDIILLLRTVLSQIIFLYLSFLFIHIEIIFCIT